MNNKPYYPIGIQNFSELRRLNAVYVDKTDQIYRLTHSSKYVFLSRPRRFGKSLLSSTMRYYFEGRRDLFTGLAIEQLESDWNQYPVLHFDLSAIKSEDVSRIEDGLSRLLRQFEAIYGKDDASTSLSSRMTDLIQQVNAQTGKKVVVLINEYDTPILEVMHDDNKREEVRNLLREFYSPLKSCDDNLHFVFLTGISTFLQLSIFSELNNLKDITNSDVYASICGITMPELVNNFQYGINSLAEKKRCTPDDVVEMLRNQYDGYHFSKMMVDVFNPFSLLNAFDDNELEDYWYQTGTPTLLIKMLTAKRGDWRFTIEDLEATKPMSLKRFNTSLELCTGPIPLLYQAGYLTIKSYDENSDLYVLGVPNTEVRVGLLLNLLPLYSEIDADDTFDASKAIAADLRDGQCDMALTRIKELLASIPFMRGDRDILGDAEKTEAYYHRLFFVIFKMLHRDVTAEVRSARGAADIVVKTKRYIYVIEIKIDSTADEALRQIDANGYAIPYLTDGRNVVKLGVNFSTVTRTIAEWKQA